MTIKGFYKRLSRKVDNDLLAVRDCLESEESAYWRMETPMIWSEAQKTCEMFRQANLVSIHNFEEKQLVYSMALDNTYFDKRTFESGGIWIGLRTLRQVRNESN